MKMPGTHVVVNAVNIGGKCVNLQITDLIALQLSNYNDQNGDNVSLKNYSGRKVVLWFFPKASTPG